MWMKNAMGGRKLYDVPKWFPISVGLLMSVILNQTLYAQDYDPPYPRIGQMYLYHPGKASEIWSKHDLVMIRHKYDQSAREIKQRKGSTIIMAANDYIVSNKNKWPDDWYIKCSGGGGCQGGKLDSYHPDFGLMNITSDSPSLNNGYGSQKFNEFLPRYLVDNTDWNYFDGTIFDYWARQVWSGADIADINNDGSPEGRDYVNQKWEEGNQQLVANLRAVSNKPVMSNEGGQLYLNGNMFEFWSKNDNKKWNSELILQLQKDGVAPILNYVNSEVNGAGAEWRVDFTMAQIVGAFVGHDEGTSAHRFTYLHDEYEADLGYPLQGTAGDPQTLESDLWVRYFDKGVIIANISGSSKTVSSSQLSGGPYWRFLGSQDSGFNNGSQFTSVTLAGYDGIMLFREPTTLVTPIVIDNVSKNMTSLGQDPVSYSGGWSQVRWPDNAERSNTGYGLGIFWGDEENIYAINPGSGQATYRPKLSLSGTYTVFEWHPDVTADGQGGGCPSVNVVINYAGGSSTKTVNQASNVGKWNSLGTFTFNTGTGGSVVINASGSCTTSSDAIRFVYGESTEVTDTTPPLSPKGVKVDQN